MKRWTCLVAALAWTNLVVSPARADDKADAEKHFRAGVALQKGEDYSAAVTAFESSLRLHPSKSALFNLANCLRALHRYPQALERLQQLKQDFPLEEPMLSTVEMQLTELQNLTGTLHVEVDQPGAEVFVDGRSIGQTPLAQPVRLGVGDHELRVVLPGFQTKIVSINLAPGAALTKQLSLETSPPVSQPATVAPPPAPSLSPEPVHTPPPDTEPEPQRTNLWTAGVVTTAAGGVLMTGGIVTGLWALSVDGHLKRSCQEDHCASDEQPQIDRLNTLTTATNVLLGLGAVATLGGVTMWLMGQPGEHARAEQADLQLHVGPRFLGGEWVQRF